MIILRSLKPTNSISRRRKEEELIEDWGENVIIIPHDMEYVEVIHEIKEEDIKNIAEKVATIMSRNRMFYNG